MNEHQATRPAIRASLGRHLADYAGSSLVLGGFLLVALILCSAIGLVERAAIGPRAADEQSSAPSGR